MKCAELLKEDRADLNVLTLTGKEAAAAFCTRSPVVGEKGSYDKVIATDFFRHFNTISRKFLMHQYEEMLAKLCFLTKKELTIVTEGSKSKSMERNGWGLRAFTKDGVSYITTLRLKQVLADFEFEIVEETVVGSMIKIKAIRMPKVDHGDYTRVAVNHIVAVDLSYRDTFFNELDTCGWRKGWKKWPKIRWMIENFHPWLFNPTMYCGRCESFIGGIHRAVVAREFGWKAIDVRVMGCWWLGTSSCFNRPLGKFYAEKMASARANARGGSTCT